MTFFKELQMTQKKSHVRTNRLCDNHMCAYMTNHMCAIPYITCDDSYVSRETSKSHVIHIEFSKPSESHVITPGYAIATNALLTTLTSNTTKRKIS